MRNVFQHVQNSAKWYTANLCVIQMFGVGVCLLGNLQKCVELLSLNNIFYVHVLS